MSVSSSLSALSIIFTGKQTLTRRTVRRIILLNNLNNSIRRRWQSGNTSNSSSSNSSHHDAVIHNNERGSASKDDDHAYCVNLVRERDREGYLCGLLMPAASRNAYFAIRALNVELSSVKDFHYMRRRAEQNHPEGSPAGSNEGEFATTRMQTTLTLQMRMQWWREAIKRIYDGSVTRDNTGNFVAKDVGSTSQSVSLGNFSVSSWQNPVIRQLEQANSEFGLTRRFLERLIDAREMDLEIKQYADIQQLIDYAEDSVSSLLYLSLECTEVREDGADLVASHAGVGIGLVTALRATPFRIFHGEVTIPADLLPPHILSQDQILSLYDDEHQSNFDNESEAARYFQEAAREMALLASGHLAQARELQGQVPRHARPCLLPIIPALNFLDQLQRENYQLTKMHKLQQEPSPAERLKLLWLLSRTWLTGVF